MIILCLCAYHFAQTLLKDTTSYIMNGGLSMCERVVVVAVCANVSSYSTLYSQ